jgi:hypothetical protein
MSTGIRIGTAMERTGRAQQITLPPLDDDQAPQETGFGSLGFAVPAKRPEDNFGVDPFGVSDDARVPLTIGDFIKAYENVLA